MSSDTYEQRLMARNDLGERDFNADDPNSIDDRNVVDEERPDGDVDALDAETDEQRLILPADVDDDDDDDDDADAVEPSLVTEDVDADDADVNDAEVIDADVTDAQVIEADAPDTDVVDNGLADTDLADTDVVDAEVIDADLVADDSDDLDAVADDDVNADVNADADVVDEEIVTEDVVTEVPVADLSDSPVDDSVDDSVDELAGAGGDMLPGALPAEDDVVIADRSDLKARWQQAQLGFIDDPAGSAETASAIAAEALEAHITALRGRLDELGTWQSRDQVDGVQDTEVLRGAVHGYRAFVQQIVGE